MRGGHQGGECHYRGQVLIGERAIETPRIFLPCSIVGSWSISTLVEGLSNIFQFLMKKSDRQNYRYIIHVFVPGQRADPELMKSLAFWTCMQHQTCAFV